MKRNYILIKLILPYETNETSCLEKIISSMADFDSRLTPEFYSNEEEKINIEFSSVSDCFDAWKAQMVSKFKPEGYYKEVEFRSTLEFAWKRKRVVKYSAVFHHSNMVGEAAYRADVRKKPWMLYGNLTIKFSPVRKDLDYLALFKKLSMVLAPLYGVLHLFTEPELCKAKFSDPITSFQLGVSSRALQTEGCLPELGWANCFSNEFNGDLQAEELPSDVLNENISNSSHITAVPLTFISVSFD